ncbi:unnamed protein product [Moneuplotes crassus]|uniref:Oxysterol-binding protein n=1 Tax=Euplotes crassus TaxID=5936 RepID=A0AAD1UHS5_EUPCR|nr:unnamed protein product [Moneuplotes crassus]
METKSFSDQKLSLDRKEELLEDARNWKPTQETGDYRKEGASSGGGFALRDKALVSKLRSAGWEAIKRIGKQLLGGRLNLIGIAFPFKCAADYSMLEALAGMARVNPYIMNAAALTEDPIERIKLLLTASVSHMEVCNTFEKPLNPVMGETYHAYLEDGTQIFCEQTCHHPPISHILIEGPDNLYEFSMYTGYSAKAGWNSVKVNVIGNKTIKFKDGTSITWNNMEDQINSTLYGTMVRQVIGRQDYKDEKNHITAYIETGAKKVQDYLKGNICQYGQEIYTINGNYNGYLEFNGERYWDIRETKVFDIIPSPASSTLPSDSRCRIDLIACKAEDKDSDIPQDKKDELEDLQRHDAKLRKAVGDYRAENPGAKFVDISLLKI